MKCPECGCKLELTKVDEAPEPEKGKKAPPARKKYDTTADEDDD